jgi:hypothetical protein
MERDIEEEPQQEDGKEKSSQNKEVIDVKLMPEPGVIERDQEELFNHLKGMYLKRS